MLDEKKKSRNKEKLARFATQQQEVSMAAKSLQTYSYWGFK
jgi:hypothetical protein